MLVLGREDGKLEDRRFKELVGLLSGEELLVLNNTRVIPARLYGKRKGIHAQAPSKATRKEHLQGQIEVFLVKQTDADVWETLVRPGRKLPVGEQITIGD